MLPATANVVPFFKRIFREPTAIRLRTKSQQGSLTSFKKRRENAPTGQPLIRARLAIPRHYSIHASCDRNEVSDVAGSEPGKGTNASFEPIYGMAAIWELGDS